MTLDYVFLLFALSIPQVVLGTSFSLPLAKKTSTQAQLPLRLYGRPGTAQAREINEQVRQKLLLPEAKSNYMARTSGSQTSQSEKSPASPC